MCMVSDYYLLVYYTLCTYMKCKFTACIYLPLTVDVSPQEIFFENYIIKITE